MLFAPRIARSVVGIGCLIIGSWLMTGCASKVPLHQAPVEDRGGAAPRSAVGGPVAEVETSAMRPAAGSENAGKVGYYTIKPGDTLIRIGLDHGQSWKDLARWNSIENPNRIEVGQVLRVAPPVAVAVAPATSSASETGVVTRPVTTSAVAPVVAGAVPPPVAAPSKPLAAASPASTPANDEELAWAWPASGSVLRGFDDPHNKGLDIGGTVGTPVLAAMDGRVVYVGSAVRGYGNLIIIKHNNTFLSAYAHNQALLVKEDQNVHKGQKIAEMGSTDADRVKLHFEIRRLGKPVDPAKYLPTR